jgi:hypothetical protein
LKQFSRRKCIKCCRHPDSDPRNSPSPGASAASTLDPWPRRCLPHHEFRLKGDLLMRVRRAALRLLDEQLGRDAAKLMLRLADGGERQRALLGELDVVVTHDRDIVRDPDTAPDQAADDTKREQVVA